MSTGYNKIYIAGPMRGKPDWNYEAFNNAEKRLVDNGWKTINPATLDSNHQDTINLNCASESFDPDNDVHHQDVNRRIMKRDVDVICDECEAIYMLKGWQNSQGACAEFYLACSIGLDIYYESSDGNDIVNRRCF